MKRPLAMRGAILASYPAVARAARLDPARLLQEAGLGGVSLGDPDLRIPVGAFMHLLALSAEEAAAEDFGLRLSVHYGLATLGPLSLVARERPTLRAALETYIRFIRIQNEAITLRLDTSGARAQFALALRTDHDADPRQAIEFWAGASLRVFAALLGAEWRPALACFRHEPPRRPHHHARLLQTQVHFRAAFDGFEFPARDLDRRLPGATPELAVHAERYLNRIAKSDGRVDMVEEVRHAIEGLLSSGLCSAERVARHMGVDRRTVHRHLARNGASFSALVEECRRALTERYLAERIHPLAEVAQMAGFSSPSAFSRWFKARRGCSPSAWRLRSRSTRAAAATAIPPRDRTRPRR